MKVDILYENKLIGHSDLDCVDPSMGVAAGPFQPTADYVRDLHASAIDGVYQERRTIQLIVRSAEFGEIDSEGTGIEDFSHTLGEIEVTVLGIAYPGYETYFAHYPNYQAFKR
ncbi:hypothetical protein [Asticcacaulis benevestitus]|uniref:hypothetical protein n=1 Tax=Asticcacaulis benevestitus TaxID=347481 RepID=UPI000477EC47|nr:hypothetical protein [Asticcacaulis benevestitus]